MAGFFEEVKPMVFAGVYPVGAEALKDLHALLEKLQLNDASLTLSLNPRWRWVLDSVCGFLELLHMEIVFNALIVNST